MKKTILIVNPGSTSLKFKLYLFPEKKILASGKVERIGDEKSPFNFTVDGKKSNGERFIPDYSTGVKLILDNLVGSILESLSDLAAVGFKTVHAGLKSFGPGAVFLTGEILAEMSRFLTAAPVHNQAYMDVIECFKKAAPEIPVAGLFEPTFHNTVTEEKYTCGIPFEWREKYGLRRYGFHGASHRYISNRAQEIMGWDEDKKKTARLVSCHLGGSSSLCAIRDEKSVDTTLEFSPQSGIIHSARCETIDPFILIFAMKEMGLTPDELSRVLCYESGLKGVSGVSGDMRDLCEAAAKGHERAKLALNIFRYQVRKNIAVMAASLQGMDFLVFTGGIGENGADERCEICKGLGYLGVLIDEKKNAETLGKEARISLPGSKVEIWVIPTNEELIVAEEVYKLIVT
jgi:acetate kinase